MSRPCARLSSLNVPVLGIDVTFAAMTEIVIRRSLLGLLVALTACGGSSGHASTSQPVELTGRWVRLRPDSTWGDTMDFRADGSLAGSAGYGVPPNLRWEIKHDSAGKAQYCATDGSNGFCRPYRLTSDRLELIGGPGGRTIFRRVP